MERWNSIATNSSQVVMYTLWHGKFTTEYPFIHSMNQIFFKSRLWILRLSDYGHLNNAIIQSNITLSWESLLLVPTWKVYDRAPIHSFIHKIWTKFSSKAGYQYSDWVIADTLSSRFTISPSKDNLALQINPTFCTKTILEHSRSLELKVLMSAWSLISYASKHFKV